MKDFTLYPEALAIKELGFNEPCFGRIYADGGTEQLSYPYKNSDQVGNVTSCSAPTYSQVFRWFREKYDLDIDISRNDQEMIDYVERKGEKYLPKYRYGYSNGTFISIGTCMKYEESELACLQKLIELVKNQSI